MKLMLESIGFSDVLELDELQTLKIDSGSVTSVPFLGEHCDLNMRSKLGYLVS
jgi:hypothetical protein